MRSLLPLDDLDDVQLFPAEEVHEQHFRPLGVPKLSFAALPLYSDEVSLGELLTAAHAGSNTRNLLTFPRRKTRKAKRKKDTRNSRAT